MEWGLTRFLHKRPLDTLLATWGLSLSTGADIGSRYIMRQTFRYLRHLIFEGSVDEEGKQYYSDASSREMNKSVHRETLRVMTEPQWA